MIKYDSNTINEWNFGSSNVTKVYRNGVVRYEKLVENYEKKYFTTVAKGDGTIGMTIGSGISTSLLSSVSYSTDNGATWTTTNNVDGEEVNVSVNVTNGDKVLWKGEGKQMTIVQGTQTTITASTTFDVEGNIMSLLNGDDFYESELDQTASFHFGYLLHNNQYLYSAENLVIPTVGNNSCRVLFGESSIVVPPSTLPSMTLVDECYRAMFYGCTALLRAPQLPAETLANYCYCYMFYGCKKLTKAPVLKAKTLADSCYVDMFYGCYDLNTIKCLATDISARNCTTDWVNGVAPYEAEVEYLEFHNDEYINTKFKGNTTTTRLEIGMMFYDNVTIANIFGSRNRPSQATSGSMNVFIYNGLRLDWVSGDSSIIAPINVDEKYDINITGGRAIVNGVEYTSANRASVNQNYNFYIGACGQSKSDTRMLKGRVYYARLYSNGELIRDMIPVRKDGVGYMYDKVNGVMYANSGSGLFGIGNDVRINTFIKDPSMEDWTIGNDGIPTDWVVKDEIPNYEFMPFTTVARTDGTINLTIGSGLTVANYEYIKYSTDNGNTWTKVDNVNGEQVNISISVNASDRVQWKGKGIRMAASTSVYTRFIGSTAQFDIEGNIMSLLEENKYVGASIKGDWTFHQLFNGCTNLINAENLILPKNVFYSSYRAMFQGCSNLLTAPKLPAETLVELCYYYMFYGCKKLTKAPVLKAKTLADSCYECMFQDCTSLIYIKCLATDISANRCLYNWVKHITTHGIFIKDPSTNWAKGKSAIPSTWTTPYDSKVEYLECFGRQYIDTLFKGNSVTTKMRAVVSVNNTSEFQGVFGQRNTYNAANDGSMSVFFINGGNFSLDWVDGTNTIRYVANNGIYDIEVTRGQYTVNGVEQTTTATTSVDANYNLLLGTVNNAGEPFHNTQNDLIGKIYSAQIYDNDELVRDMIPVRKDGIGYMYDNVSGKLFGNQGDGMFGIGADVE